MRHAKIIAAELSPAVWSHWISSPADAELLIALRRRADPGDRDWNEYFVEALADYLLARSDPSGFVTGADATWLIAQFGGDNPISAITGRALLDRLFDQAQQLPRALRDYRRKLARIPR